MLISHLCPDCMEAISEYGTCCTSLLEDICEAYYASGGLPVIIQAIDQERCEIVILEEKFWRIYYDSPDGAVLKFLESKGYVKTTEFSQELISTIPCASQIAGEFCFHAHA